MLQIPLVVVAIGLTALTAAGSSGIRNEIIAIARDNLAAFEQVIDLGVLTGKLPQYRPATVHFLLVGRA
jgi:hypothetical protein